MYKTIISYLLGIGLFILNISPGVALEERHLIMIRHGEHRGDHLTKEGRGEVLKAAEMLLNHGFDNRAIAAVYVSPHKRAIETAEILSEFGIFTKNKIHVEERLGQSILIREAIIKLYDEVENQYSQGHVVFVSDEGPSSELIEILTQTKVNLQTAGAYLVPLSKRSA